MEPYYLATPAANSPGRAEPGFYWRTALRFVRRRETGRSTPVHGGDYSHHRQRDVSPPDYCGVSSCVLGGVLAVLPDWTYADTSVALAPGDRLFFSTDGVTEAAGTVASSAAELKSKIMRAVEEFCHREFRDDVTLVLAGIR
jgi:Stage II sporulation protein E (SpoIIE)